MKKLLFVLMVLCALPLSAFGAKNTQAGSADVTIADSKEEKAKEIIIGLINELYAAAAQNAGDIDKRFACHAWRDMVAAVNEKDAQLEEIGFFNDDYWTMMQDANPDDLKARDIQFEQLDVEKGTATVSFILHSSVQTIRQKFSFCREDGDWRVHDIIRFYNDPDDNEASFSFMESMQSYLNETQEDVLELTYENMDGIYDSMDEDMNSVSRIGLNKDGTATWCMIGSLNYTEYTYTIEGNTICMKVKGVDSEEDCYEYDADTRTLKNEQGSVYYRQVVE